MFSKKKTLEQKESNSFNLFITSSFSAIISIISFISTSFNSYSDFSSSWFFLGVFPVCFNISVFISVSISNLFISNSCNSSFVLSFVIFISYFLNSISISCSSFIIFIFLYLVLPIRFLLFLLFLLFCLFILM